MNDIVSGIDAIVKELALTIYSVDSEETIENLTRRNAIPELLKCTYLGTFNVMNTFNVTKDTFVSRDNHKMLNLLFEEVWHGMVSCLVIDQFGNTDYASAITMSENFSLKYGIDVDSSVVSVYEASIKNLIGEFNYIDEEIIFIGWDVSNCANFVKLSGYVL